MCQAKRPSPAQKQAEAIADVERIAKGVFEEVWAGEGHWERLSERAREVWRGWVRNLLRRDLIRPGARPLTAPEPMAGQTTIEQQLSPFELEDLCDADD